MRKFITKKLLFSLVAFITLVSASITLYADFIIEYDLFRVESNICFCENCGGHTWNLDIEQRFEDVFILNIQCSVCHSEFHLTNPIELTVFLGNN